MSNVDDIDLDVTSDDVEDSGPREVNAGRYLFQLVEMGVQESSAGTVFLYQARAIDTQISDNEECLGNRVFEIINVDKWKMKNGEIVKENGEKVKNKTLWRLSELLGGGFGIKEWKKIPSEIMNGYFTALAYVEKFNGEEKVKLKKHALAAGWEGMNAVVDDDGKVTMTSKPGDEKKKAKDTKDTKESNPKGDSGDSGGPEDDDIEF